MSYDRQFIGCVSADGQPLDYGFRWHDSEIPIGEKVTAVEKAILECAFAGCDSIWVTCPAKLAVILRHKLGDTIIDPILFTVTKFVNHKQYDQHLRRIPIFYIPMKYTDRGKRDSYAWAALNSGWIAHQTQRNANIRGNVDRYYLAFPFGAFPYRVILKNRAKIWTNDRVFISHEGKTIKDGLWLSCVIQHQDLLDLRRWVMDSEAVMAKTGTKLRYNSRRYTLKDVYENLPVGNDLYLPIRWYYDLSSWGGLLSFFKEQSGYTNPYMRLFEKRTTVKL